MNPVWIGELQVSSMGWRASGIQHGLESSRNPAWVGKLHEYYRSPAILFPSYEALLSVAVY